MYAGVPTTLPDTVETPEPAAVSELLGRLRQVALAIAREAPVDDDGLAERADDDVRRLEVAVDHALAVRVADRVGDRDHVRQQAEPLAQRRRARRSAP